MRANATQWPCPGVDCRASMVAAEISSRQLGPYSIERLIGRGGMGTVYEAVHRQLGRRIALKVLHPQNADQPLAWARFVREARAAAQLRHPNVVSVFDVGHESGQAFLAMDLLEGPTLEEWLREHGPLDLSAAVDVFLPIASGVCAAHEAGIIHRDLKPGNVVLTRNRSGAWCPVVVDFGISKLLSDQDFVTRSDALLGTLPYLAPELARSASAAAPGTDQYALGVMLYECVTAQRPFSGTGPYELLHAIVTASSPRPSEINPRLPVDLDAIVCRAMARSPDARYPSVQALAAALLSFGTRRAWFAWGAEFAALPSNADPGPTDTHPELDRPSRAPAPKPLEGAKRSPAILGLLLASVVGAAGLGAFAAAAVLRHTSPVAPSSSSCSTNAQVPPLAAEVDRPAIAQAAQSESPDVPGQSTPVAETPASSLPAPGEVARVATASSRPREQRRSANPTASSAGRSSPPEPLIAPVASPRDDGAGAVILGSNQAPILR